MPSKPYHPYNPSMSGISWEREVANYLEKRGYSIKLRETIQDHEIDVYAEKDGRILVVE